MDFGVRHLVGWSGDEVAAYARILPPGTRFNEPSIGRVLTTRDYRRTGLGRDLMARALAHTDTAYPEHELRISAQTYLDRFYRGFGF